MKKYIGFAVMLLLAVSNFAIAEQSEALNWLSDQQGVNGSVYLESDVANADQSTYEAAQALSNSVDSRFSANIARASAFLNDSDATTLSTESLSRRILLKASASLELDQDVQELLSRRSARGGYGDYADVPPSILSTAFSLRALGSVGVPADGQTIQYLLNQQQADGSWSFPILGEPSVELTAYAMNSLWMYRNELNLNASLDSAQAFLETQIDSVTNLWATTEASALVLIALLERNVDRSAYQTSIDTLISQQLANGSYENDVYLTGLISRLIEIANEPANDAISISGRVLDGDSGLPLPSVNVQLTGSGDTGVSTGSDGRFTLSIDLAGSYQLAFVLDSYGKAMLQTTLADGDQQTLNDVILTKLAEDPDTGDPVTTGTVRGNVSASINGEPLAGVLIIVNNQTGLSATTDSQGNYLITNVSEGPITTEASLDGYQSLSGGANISSNQTLIFSPELSEIVPSTATVFGSVKDAVSGDLLEGSTVTVTVNGSDFVSTTDLSGSYQIVDVPSGPISYSATLEDYQTVSGSLNALDGANINFSPALQPTPVIEEPITNGIVSGNVTNSQSGAPLLGVVVTVNDQASLSATTDAQGSYLIANVPIGVVTVVASIDGFQSATSAASIAENQTLTFSPALTEVIPSSVTLFGSVKDSVSGNLLEGSTITATVNGSDFLATTDQNGVYQISGVPSGLISFTAARSGYQTASGSLNGLDGQSIDVSPLLVPISTATGGIWARIVDSESGRALANVSINVTNSNASQSVSFTSDQQGLFEAAELALGPISLELSSPEYVTQTLSLEVLESVNLDLGTLNLEPVNIDTNATVEGTVVNAATGEVLVDVNVTSDSNAVSTSADGRFVIDNIAGGEFNLSFEKEGFQNVDFSLVVQAGQDLDLARIRMREDEVTQLLPDLSVISIDTSGLSTDLQSLDVSGDLQVQISNSGNQRVDSSINLVAFSDKNRNGEYDLDIDSVLGDAFHSSGLAPNESSNVSVMIAGVLDFRDAPIQLKVDSDSLVVELNERNNIRSTAEECSIDSKCSQLVTTLGQPVEKWSWTGSAVEPEFNKVMMTPLVAQTNDDNGDGKIDQLDFPDVIFSSFSRETAGPRNGRGLIRIISGVDGSDLAAFSNTIEVEAYGSLAAGDIDGDGEIEIIAPSSLGLYAFELDGSIKWLQADLKDVGWGGATLADVDGDGITEVLAGGALLDNQGNILWATGIDGGQAEGGFGLVVDLDNDGINEIVFGGSAFDLEGNRIWTNVERSDGLTALGNFDDDDRPEIVLVRDSNVLLIDDDGQTIWRQTLPSGRGGAPTIADLDGDGEPEIGIAGRTTYTAFDTDGTIVWNSSIFEGPSNVTGSTVFDFDNNGTVEIVYADERFIYIYDGATGSVISQLPHSSITTYENPVVVDIDNDGHAEIVVAENDIQGSFTGIRVFEEENDSWVGTRSIWNQHAYSIDNVNDDGTIPTDPVKGWLTHNTFRLNTFPQCVDGSSETSEQTVYLNDQNITVSLGASMAAEPFENRNTVDSLASIIDADTAESGEDHNQQTHVWVKGGPLSLRFDFGREYDLRTLHFWNYFSEGFDVDNIDFRFFDSQNVFVGALSGVQPALGGNNANPIFSEDIPLFFPSNIQYVEAVLTGSNGEVDFNNIGFTAVESGVFSATNEPVLDVEVLEGYSVELFAENVTTQQGPVQLALNEEGDLFIALGDRGISKIPAGTNTPEPFGDFNVRDSDGVVVDSEGNIVVGGSIVTKYTPTGSVIWQLRCPVANVQAIGLDKDDNVYVGSLGTAICKISRDGVLLETIGGFNQPSEVTSTSNDLLYIGQSSGPGITVLSLDESRIVDVLDTSFLAIQPTADQNGNLYTGMYQVGGAADRIGVINFPNTTVKTIARGLGNSTFTFDKNGVIYAGDNINKVIYKITPPEAEAVGRTDLSVSKVSLVESGLTISARIGNGGATFTPEGIKATAYRISSDGTRQTIGSIELPELASGEFVDLQFNNIGGFDADYRIEVVVDSEDELRECDETNNSMGIGAAEPELVDASIGLVLNQDTVSSNDAVLITSIARNTGNTAADFIVRTFIEDEQGNNVISFVDVSLEQLGRDASTNVESTWNTTEVLTGTYIVRTGIYSSEGDLLDETSDDISVVSDVEQRISLRTTTDRIEYHINDSVQIDDLVRNLSVNSIERSASLSVVVNAPNGSIVFNDMAVIGDLTPSYSNSYFELLALNNAAVGQYNIVGTVLSSGGEVLATDGATFNVVNDIRIAITGSVGSSTPEVFIGDELYCFDSLVNSTSLSVDDLAIRQLLVNIDDSELVSTTETTVSLVANQELDLDQRALETGSLSVGNYSCSLQAFIDNGWVNLDNAFFEVKEQPIQIELSASMGDKGRVLILLDDSEQCTDEPFGPRSTPSLIEQQTFLENLLDDAGWSYTITLNANDFTRELRTGGYSNYMLMSELTDLPHYVQKEVREAVYRGEGLVEAGKRLQPYEVILEAQGINHRGQERRATGLTLLESELSEANNVTFSHRDNNVRITARGATVVAEYQGSQSSHHHGQHSHGFGFYSRHNAYWYPPVHRTSPAVTVNEFGLGKSVFVGFDVLLEAVSMGSDEGVYAQLILDSLAAVDPEPPLTTIGTDYPIVFSVSNIGSATAATFVLPIPDTVSVVDAGEGVIDEATQSISWSLDLSEGDFVEIPLWVEIPELATALTGVVITGEGVNGVERATASIELVPEEAIDINDVIETTKQARALKRVKHSLLNARWYLHKGRTEKALRSLLTATSHVANIQKYYDSENLSALRVNIDLLIKQVAKQVVVAEPRHRCLVRGSWGGYHYPRGYKRCGQRPRGWGHHGGGSGYYSYKQLENDLSGEQ